MEDWTTCRWRTDWDIEHNRWIQCGATPTTRWGWCAEHNARWDADHTQTCRVCGTTRYDRWLPRDPKRWMCSDDCRRAWRAKAQRERRAVQRRPPQPRICAHCRHAFTPTRSDARFCSGACRVAAHRAKS